jgi:hypothetical protein
MLLGFCQMFALRHFLDHGVSMPVGHSGHENPELGVIKLNAGFENPQRHCRLKQ